MESVCTASKTHKLAVQMPPSCQEFCSSISASAGTSLSLRPAHTFQPNRPAVQQSPTCLVKSCSLGWVPAPHHKCSFLLKCGEAHLASKRYQCSGQPLQPRLLLQLHPCKAWYTSDSRPTLRAIQILNTVADLSNPCSLLIQRLLNCCRNLMLHVWHLLSSKGLLHSGVSLLLCSILQTCQAGSTADGGTRLFVSNLAAPAHSRGVAAPNEAPIAQHPGFLNTHVSLLLGNILHPADMSNTVNSCWWDCMHSCFPLPSPHLLTASKSLL